jgi:hypothetical protein
MDGTSAAATEVRFESLVAKAMAKLHSVVEVELVEVFSCKLVASAKAEEGPCYSKVSMIMCT